VVSSTDRIQTTAFLTSHHAISPLAQFYLSSAILGKHRAEPKLGRICRLATIR